LRILNSCVMGRILRTIYFKNKRIEQYSWHKEGEFIVKRDMLLPGNPIILKYKIKKRKTAKVSEKEKGKAHRWFMNGFGFSVNIFNGETDPDFRNDEVLIELFEEKWKKECENHELE